jgi:NADPH-dependent curcumin reductase CurA
MGATVYTTAGSQAKWDYLTSEMGMPAEHISKSRDLSFVEAIKKTTGNGINVL